MLKMLVMPAKRPEHMLASVSALSIAVDIHYKKCRNKRWVRWETEWSFDGKLCQEYSRQKLSKSDNWFSSYCRKCRGCFFETQCTRCFIKKDPFLFFS